MFIKSNVVPSIIHLVRRNPLRLHLHSGKYSWGNFAFSFVTIDSMLPVWIVFPSTISKSWVKKFQILMFLMESWTKYKLPKACRKKISLTATKWIMRLESRSARYTINWSSFDFQRHSHFVWPKRQQQCSLKQIFFFKEAFRRCDKYICMNDNNFINTFQLDDANRQTHILHTKKNCDHYWEEMKRVWEEKKTHCEVFRWIIIFIEKHANLVVIGETFRFA